MLKRISFSWMILCSSVEGLGGVGRVYAGVSGVGRRFGGMVFEKVGGSRGVVVVVVMVEKDTWGAFDVGLLLGEEDMLLVGDVLAVIVV